MATELTSISVVLRWILISPRTYQGFNFNFNFSICHRVNKPIGEWAVFYVPANTV